MVLSRGLLENARFAAPQSAQRVRNGLLVSAVVLLLLIPNRSPGQQETPEATFGETVEVRVVDLDVVVVDRRGRPVGGLTKEDFEVREDGAPVEIRYFRAPTAADNADRTGRANPEVAPEAAAEAPSRPPRRLFAVYLDDDHLPPGSARRVHQALFQLLEAGVFEGAELALLRRRGKVELLVPPTKDSARVLEVVRANEKPTGQGNRLQIARRAALTAVVDTWEACEIAPNCIPCVDVWGQMVAIARGYAASAQATNDSILAGLSRATTILGTFPGRSTLLVVSEGLTFRPGLALYDHLGGLCPELHRQDADALMRETNLASALNQAAAIANTDRVTLYPLDPGGLRASSSMDTSIGNRRLLPTSINDQLRLANLEGPLHQLAEETGGKALLNANRPAQAIAGAASELAYAYSIGFVPAHPASGRTHLLDVRLVGRAAKAGRRLRYRRQYLDRTQEHRDADRLAAALLTGKSENPLGVELSITTLPVDPNLEGRKRARALRTVRVRVVLPPEKVAHWRALAATNERNQGFKIWLTGRNHSNLWLPMRTRTFEAPPGGSALDLAIELEAGIGTWQMAVAVRDLGTGTTTFQTREVTVD